MYETMNVKARPTDAFSSIRRVILEDLPKGSSTRRRCSCVADDYDKICNCSIGNSLSALRIPTLVASKYSIRRNVNNVTATTGTAPKMCKEI